MRYITIYGNGLVEHARNRNVKSYVSWKSSGKTYLGILIYKEKNGSRCLCVCTKPFAGYFVQIRGISGLEGVSKIQENKIKKVLTPERVKEICIESKSLIEMFKKSCTHGFES